MVRCTSKNLKKLKTQFPLVPVVVVVVVAFVVAFMVAFVVTEAVAMVVVVLLEWVEEEELVVSTRKRGGAWKRTASKESQ